MWRGGVGVVMGGLLLACGPVPGGSSGDIEPGAPRPAPVVDVDGGVTGEGACARAERWMARARELRGEGWVHRPLRLARRARGACTEKGDEAFEKELVGALSPGDASKLWTERVAAEKRGDQKAARTLGARWVAAMEAGTKATARVAQRPESERVLSFAADASAVVVGSANEIAIIDAATGLPTHFVASPLPRAAELRGDHVLVVDQQGDVIVRSLATGAQVQKMSWTGESYVWATFVDGGRRVLCAGSSGWDGIARLFDVKTGDSAGTVKASTGERIEKAVLVNDDVAVVGGRGGLFVVDNKTMTVAHTLEVPLPAGESSSFHTSVVSIAAAPPKTVAAAMYSGRVLVWRLPDTKPIAEVETGDHEPSVALSADGSRLVVGLSPSFDGEVRTIEVSTGKAVRSHPAPGDQFLFGAHGTRALAWGRLGSLHMLDESGNDRWPALPVAQEIEGAALSLGLVLTVETSGADSMIHAHGWYRQHARHFSAPGYRGEVLAISPSGRHAAAVVSNAGRIWAIHTGTEESFGAADARGFPDTLVFDGEKVLRLGFERPATAWSARYPFDAWHEDTSAGKLDGFLGTALSSTGALVARGEDGAVGLMNTGATLIERGAGGFGFSGDGTTLFVGDGKKLVSFNASGKRVAEHAVPCAPGRLAADRSGDLVAFACGDDLVTFGEGAKTRKTSMGDMEAIHISPDGHLIAVRSSTALHLVVARTLELAATITIRGGEALVTSPSGAVARWDEASAWKGASVCRIGHRAYPLDACQDKLTDDALLDALLAPR